jgi:predicted nuclease of predicted toxin-antitoxin system
MILLFDANISYWIVKKLQKDFPNSIHVNRIGLQIPISDKMIWQFAKANNLIIVTNDEDFYELSNLYGSPPKVVWLRLGTPPTEKIVQRLLKHKSDIENLENDIDIDLLEIY